MDDILDTERLTLRRYTTADIADFLVLDTDPGVMRFIGSGVLSRLPRERWLRDRLAEGWPAQGGLWTVREREGGRFLGWSVLCPIPLLSSRYGTQLYEIGYRYLPTAWGRGIATEAARRVLDFGFRELGHDLIVGVTHPENWASQRVLQKIGLRREGERVAYGHSVPYFSLTRQTYLRRAAETDGRG
jgi:[ribosomal protein S5]-alanine N-acetyltransferase